MRLQRVAEKMQDASQECRPRRSARAWSGVSIEERDLNRMRAREAFDELTEEAKFLNSL
jgi:hypothetical protein